MKKLVKLQFKRTIVFLLAVVMVFGALPISGLAQEYIDPERASAAEEFGRYTENYYEALGLANWSDEALLDEAIRLYDAKEYDALRSFLTAANALLDASRKESLLAAYSEEYGYLLDPPAQSAGGRKLLGASAESATAWTANNTNGPLSSAVLKITKADGTIIEKSGYSIYNACSAAGDGGAITIPAGIWYVDSIQDTYGSYRVTIEGETGDPSDTKLVARTGQGGYVDDKLVTSTGFMGTLYNDWVNKGKAYNSKAVLRIGSGDTTVKNLTLDGGTFGSTSVKYNQTEGSSSGCDKTSSGGYSYKTGSPDFDVLRCNGNTNKSTPTNILLDNVVIAGQKAKTTIQVGTSSAYANVTARKSVIGQNGNAFYASADTCSGSKFTTVDTWIEGFALGDAESMNLGAGYYTVSFGGQTGHITIPSAIQFYKENGESLSGMKDVLQQGAGEGTTVVAKMTKDLCDSFNSPDETKLYGQTADELYTMIVEFRTALASLAGDNGVDVSAELAALDIVIGSQEEPTSEEPFKETKEEKIEVTIADDKTGDDENTGLPKVIETEDETLKSLSEDEKEDLRDEVEAILNAVSKPETVVDKNLNIEIDIKDNAKATVEETAIENAKKFASESGKPIEAEEALSTQKKLSMELQSLPVVKDDEGKAHVEQVVWDIKPVIVVIDEKGDTVYEEIITNENLKLTQPLEITLPVMPTKAKYAEIIHISDNREMYPDEFFKKEIENDNGNQFVRIKLTHFSQVFQSDLREEDIAEIVGGDKYPSLEAAFTEARDGDMIKLLADVEETCTVPKGKTVILSGGVRKLTGVITAEGELKVYDGKFANVPVGMVKLLGGIFDSCPDAGLCETGFVATKDENAETYTVHPDAVIKDRAAINAKLADVSHVELPLTKLPVLFGTADTNAAFSFKPSASEDNMGGYAKWNADFEVSFDQDVAKDSLILVGSYGGSLYPQYKNLGFFWPYAYKTTDDPFRLLKSVDKFVNYGELFTEVGGSFDCGVVNLSEENVGTTMTVRLYMYEANSKEDLDGAKKILISEKNYTICQVSSFKGNDEKEYIYSGMAEKNIPAGAFYIFDGIVKAENDVTINVATAYYTDEIKYAAQIGENKYGTLQAAIKAAIPGDTVKLLDNITLTENLTVAKKAGDDVDKHIILDLAGKNITCTDTVISVAKTGALTVKDSVGNGSIAAIQVEGGMLTVKSGKVNGITGSNQANVFIEGVTIAENVNVSSGNIVSVTGGTIEKGFTLSDCANASVTGGTFNCTVSGEQSKYIRGGRFTAVLDDQYIAEGYELKDGEVVKSTPHTHSYGIWQSDNDSTHSRECSCGEKEIAGHSFGKPSFLWSFYADGSVRVMYSSTCSVCGHRIIEIVGDLTYDDTHPDYTYWTASVEIGGRTYSETKQVEKSYTVTINGCSATFTYDGKPGTSGAKEVPYGATVVVTPTNEGAYDYAKNGVPAAFNATTLTLRVTENVTINLSEHTTPVTQPSITLTTEERTEVSGKYKVPFKISWAISNESKCKFVEAGYYYRYGGTDGASITDDEVKAKGSVKKTSLTSLNGSYKCTHSYSSSYATRNIYAIGYLVYKDVNGQQHTIYTEKICNNYIQ